MLAVLSKEAHVQRRPGSNPRSLITILLFCIASAGCASMPRADGEPNDDPLEPFNRKVFYANRVIDGVLIRPAAEAYRGVVPRFVQDRFRNVLYNLAEVRILANNILQWRWSAAGTTFSRFVLNSTAGVAGLFDIATGEGLMRQSGDFGQTLHGWGFGEGIYLVLPIFGPSNVRDAVGLGVDLFTTAPGPYLPHSSSDAVIAVRIGDGVDLRSRTIDGLDLIEKSSIDYYAQLKSIVRQRRQVDLRAVRPVKDEPGERDLIDPGAPPARTSPGEDRRKEDNPDSPSKPPPVE
jgi:phospholipid-binding lipoprotein MlaA